MKSHELPHLDEHTLNPDPIKQFKIWFNDAINAKIPYAEAMTLATATADGKPSARIVLLKLVDERGFVFYTNYNSRKGTELDSNPKAALVFFWAPLDRQVRVEGTVGIVSAEESDAYFSSRSRDAQLSSLTSKQSFPIVSRKELDIRFDELTKEFHGKPIDRPSHWGGYRVKPLRIEFWQSRFARLNDRILYTIHGPEGWRRTRLQP